MHPIHKETIKSELDRLQGTSFFSFLFLFVLSQVNQMSLSSLPPPPVAKRLPFCLTKASQQSLWVTLGGGSKQSVSPWKGNQTS